MEKYLNKKICSECGGICCKKCGCMYLPEDFVSMEYESLLNVIKIGNISISISIFNIFYGGNSDKSPTYEKISPNHNILWSYYLYLRARNINRDIIDFFGIEGTCSILGDKGCKYSDSERPSLGLSLIPRKAKDGGCVQLADKYSYEIMYDWIRYQKVLEQIIINISGKTSIDLIAEKSKLEPDSSVAYHYKNMQNYICPDDAIKIKCEMNNRIIEEEANVKELILSKY